MEYLAGTLCGSHFSLSTSWQIPIVSQKYLNVRIIFPLCTLGTRCPFGCLDHHLLSFSPAFNRQKQKSAGDDVSFQRNIITQRRTGEPCPQRRCVLQPSVPVQSLSSSSPKGGRNSTITFNFFAVLCHHCSARGCPPLSLVRDKRTTAIRSEMRQLLGSGFQEIDPPQRQPGMP